MRFGGRAGLFGNIPTNHSLRPLKSISLNRRKFIAFAPLAASLFAACSIFPQYKTRVRLTLSLLTAGGIKTQSSVSELRWIVQPRQFGIISEVIGHALLFDLGTNGRLIAALSPSNGLNSYPAATLQGAVAMAFCGFDKYNSLDEDAISRVALFRGKKNIPTGFLPEFIWFNDISRPWNAIILTSQDLDQITPETKVVAATVETTSDSPERRFRNPPHWLVDILTDGTPRPAGAINPYGYSQFQGK